MVKSKVIDWKGVNDVNGKVIPFSVEERNKLFDNLPEVEAEMSGKKEPSTFGVVAATVFLVFVFGTIIYGIWLFFGWFNWEYGYKERVETLVCEMVDDEKLKAVCE